MTGSAEDGAVLLRPQALAVRAQTAAILARFCRSMQKQEHAMPRADYFTARGTTVLYLPLDNRPVNDLRVEALADSTGIDVYKRQAERIAAEKGYTMVEDAGRGYRQVVPSPKPVDVIEKNTVRALINGGCVVITVGGGGIPVVRRDGKLYGTPAVIDKDFASAKLAELVQADALVILTAVDRVCINWGKPDQKSLAEMTVAEAERYCEEGHFAPGSCLLYTSCSSTTCEGPSPSLRPETWPFSIATTECDVLRSEISCTTTSQ